MTKREKVIAGLKSHGYGESKSRVCSGCPYDTAEFDSRTACHEKLISDALAVLESSKGADEYITVPARLVDMAADVLKARIHCLVCEYYTEDARHCESWNIYTEPYGFCYRAERRQK